MVFLSLKPIHIQYSSYLLHLFVSFNTVNIDFLLEILFVLFSMHHNSDTFPISSGHSSHFILFIYSSQNSKCTLKFFKIPLGACFLVALFFLH